VGLEGKVALVTGGAAGIGGGIARRLLSEGAQVVVADVRLETDAGWPADLVDPQRALFLCADVTREEDLQRSVRAAVDRFGGLDILVNNAGILRFTPLDALTRADWDAVLAVNLGAPAFCAKEALPHLLVRGGGAIVNVSSIQAVLTAPHFAAYAASKAGLLGLTRSLALELGPAGIRVNAVLPGYTRTALFMSDAERLGEGDPQRFIDRLQPTIALRRLGEPEDVAGVVAFLCSDDARYVTGAAIAIDAGVTVQL
jgi:NAD(P)-dependent dehydrogenase (short-subunit alcohol dehydrogenase family)